MTGAETTFSSSTMASCRPTLSPVTRRNCAVPFEFIVMETPAASGRFASRPNFITAEEMPAPVICGLRVST